jgi:predicted SAM-dependent methyltransferase
MIEKIKYYFTKIHFFVLQIFYRIKLFLLPKHYPNNSDSKVLIHLGCGEINSPEFINVDGRFFPHIHHVSEINRLPFFKNDFADLIYASHILEHIPMVKLEIVLLEWKRVLKYGGILRIGVPDFDTIIKIYKDNQNDINAIWQPLMGGQEYMKNFHYAVFNLKFITDLLIKCGFRNVNLWDPEKVEYHKFNDWTSLKYEVKGIVYPLSLNVEAIK